MDKTCDCHPLFIGCPKPDCPRLKVIRERIAKQDELEIEKALALLDG